MYLEKNLTIYQKVYLNSADLCEKIKKIEAHSIPLFKTSHFLPDAKVSKSRMMIFLGLGDADFFFKFIQAIQGQNYQIVVFEKSLEVMAQLWKSKDWSEIISNPNVHIFVGDENQEQHYLSRLSAGSLLGAISSYVFVKIPYKVEDEKFYEEALNSFFSIAQLQFKRFAAFPEDAYRGLVNYFRNAKYLSVLPRFEKLSGLGKGYPGIVVAAGPSLKFTLPLLKKIKENAVIICVDAVYQLLLENDIVPHFVTCLERTGTTDFFKNTDTSCSRLIATPVVAPDTLKCFEGPKYILPSFGQGHEFFYFGLEGNDLGASSATMAFVALNHLGCSNIFLFGQDLAFDRFSDDSHVSGVWEDVRQHGHNLYKEIKNKKSQNNLVQGNDESLILTQECWIQFRDDFVRLSEKWKQTIHNVIPKSYGAKIPGAKWLDPDQCDEFFNSSKLLDKNIFDQVIPFSDENFLEPIRNAVLFLEDEFVYTLLQLEDKLSLYHIDHPTMVSSQTLHEKYQQLFVYLENEENHILKKNKRVVEGLLHPLFCYLIPKMNYDLGKIEIESEEISEQITRKIDVLLEHYKDLIYWALRVSHLLKNYLAEKL